MTLLSAAVLACLLAMLLGHEAPGWTAILSPAPPPAVNDQDTDCKFTGSSSAFSLISTLASLLP